MLLMISFETTTFGNSGICVISKHKLNVTEYYTPTNALIVYHMLV